LRPYTKGKTKGSTSVRPKFSDVVATNLPFTVTNDKTAITELIHKTGWSSGTTFNGGVGTTKTLTVEARFDDGTRFENVINNGIGIAVSNLVAASSNDVSAITLSSNIVATLVGNSHKATVITVEGYCADNTVDQTASDDVSVNPNLTPALGDIDLGALYGLPFPAKSEGETLTVQVRVNAGSDTLITLQVVPG